MEAVGEGVEVGVANVRYDSVGGSGEVQDAAMLSSSLEKSGG